MKLIIFLIAIEIISSLSGCYEINRKKLKDQDTFYSEQYSSCIDLLITRVVSESQKEKMQTGDSICLRRLEMSIVNKSKDTLLFRTNKDDSNELVPTSIATKKNGNWGLFVCDFMSSNERYLPPNTSKTVYLKINPDVDSVKVNLNIKTIEREIYVSRFFNIQ